MASHSGPWKSNQTLDCVFSSRTRPSHRAGQVGHARPAAGEGGKRKKKKTSHRKKRKEKEGRSRIALAKDDDAFHFARGRRLEFTKYPRRSFLLLLVLLLPLQVTAAAPTDAGSSLAEVVAVSQSRCLCLETLLQLALRLRLIFNPVLRQRHTCFCHQETLASKGYSSYSFPIVSVSSGTLDIFTQFSHAATCRISPTSHFATATHLPASPPHRNRSSPHPLHTVLAPRRPDSHAASSLVRARACILTAITAIPAVCRGLFILSCRSAPALIACACVALAAMDACMACPITGEA